MTNTPETAISVLEILKKTCDSWRVENAPTNVTSWKFERNVPMSTLNRDGWVWCIVQGRVVTDTECEWIDKEALQRVADIGSLRYRVFVSKASEEGGGLDGDSLFLAIVTSEDDKKPVFISLQPD
jgi:hypothetical protein